MENEQPKQPRYELVEPAEDILCDCGDLHDGFEVNATMLEWTCPKTGKMKRDVNA